VAAQRRPRCVLVEVGGRGDVQEQVRAAQLARVRHGRLDVRPHLTTYSDAKVANRDIRIWHLVIECVRLSWLASDTAASTYART
jgi:hypothetical protein